MIKKHLLSKMSPERVMTARILLREASDLLSVDADTRAREAAAGQDVILDALRRADSGRASLTDLARSTRLNLGKIMSAARALAKRKVITISTDPHEGDVYSLVKRAAFDQEIVRRTEKYAELVQETLNKYFAAHHPKLTPPTITLDRGPKYWRIVKNEGSSRSVHTFVDMENGDILKAKGWKGPERTNPRGNVRDPDFGMRGVTQHGAVYLRAAEDVVAKAVNVPKDVYLRAGRRWLDAIERDGLDKAIRATEIRLERMAPGSPKAVGVAQYLRAWLKEEGKDVTPRQRAAITGLIDRALRHGKEAHERTARADRDWADGDRSAPRTPWGQAQTEYKIVPGVSWFSTAGHGGMRVAPSVARKMLSPAAIKHGEVWGGAFWYEEDVAYSIPFLENPEWDHIAARKMGSRVGRPEEHERTIRQYFPRYFQMREEGFRLPDPPKVGDRMRFTRLADYGSGITYAPGDEVVVTKVTRSLVVFRGKGDRLYSARMQRYLDGDIVKVTP